MRVPQAGTAGRKGSGGRRVDVGRKQRASRHQIEDERRVDRLRPVENDQFRHSNQRADQRICEGFVHVCQTLAQESGVRVRASRLDAPQSGTIIDVPKKLILLERKRLVRHQSRDAFARDRLDARIVIVDQHAPARYLDDAGSEQRNCGGFHGRRIVQRGALARKQVERYGPDRCAWHPQTPRFAYAKEASSSIIRRLAPTSLG